MILFKNVFRFYRNKILLIESIYVDKSFLIIKIDLGMIHSFNVLLESIHVQKKRNDKRLLRQIVGIENVHCENEEKLDNTMPYKYQEKEDKKSTFFNGF